uniref:Propionate--CoA ligase n=1 Tax=Globisporangium ultimum (strain ATCC 200006 / CBS 805.95 / DAOM BR144) TaxID=431595 RepID=K3X8H0_GLOUD
MKSYIEQYQRSLQSPQDFWSEAAKDIEWFKACDKVLDTSTAPMAKWFTGGQMNTCYNALDVHVNNGRGDAIAIRYDSPLTSTKKSVTYRELLEKGGTKRFVPADGKLGLRKGDRVIIYMPAILESTIAMLACARLGAIHSVVFGGFAAKELAARIDDAQPKLIIAASCGVEPKGVIDYEPLLNGALERAQWKPERSVVFQREMSKFTYKKGVHVDWNYVMASGSHVDAVPVLATDPLYILYTSGTTGKPKGVVRDNGGHAVALKWSMSNIMNTHQGETYWAASDIGWVVGHSYIVYGPLLQGCMSILYEGKPVGTPDAGAYWRILSEYGVKTMLTAPTALRAIRKEDPDAALLKDKKEDVHKTFKAMFVAGERGDPKTLKFFADQLEVPIIDHWWQTETGWPMSSQVLGMRQDHVSGTFPGIKFGSVSRPVPGYDIQLMSAEGGEDDEYCNYHHDAELGTDQELVVKLPLPPGLKYGALTTLYNNDADFHAKYLKKFPGYYHTGDTGHIDEDGYVYVMSRTDDVINVAGHRLCTGSIEEVIQSIPEVVECAVFGATDALKGQIPVALLVLKNGIARTEKEIMNQVITNVRHEIGSFVCLKSVAVVPALPKTRSGKVMRATIQAIADSRAYRVPATIENEAVLVDVRAALQRVGYADQES